jgi:hypothetical protein
MKLKLSPDGCVSDAGGGIGIGQWCSLASPGAAAAHSVASKIFAEARRQDLHARPQTPMAADRHPNAGTPSKGEIRLTRIESATRTCPSFVILFI